MTLLSILLQAKSGGADMWSNITMIGLILLVFYFFMIRPQQAKAKAATKFREGLKKGDTVVTIGGEYGKIVSFESDDTVIIEIASTVKVKYEKAAISMEASQKAQQKEEKATVA